MTLYLLSDGDGSDGDAWRLAGIYTTREKAIAAKQAYEAVPISRGTGKLPPGVTSHYFRKLNDIEEWETDAPVSD